VRRLIAHTRFRRDHRWTPDHLSDFVDGDLPARARARLQRHVAECPDCHRALAGLQRLLERLHGLTRPGSGETPEIASAVRRRLHDASEH
jgi:anti-sigma factor RsiW